ncbi:unnamed protein product [Bursaphelenchus xylophilus]|uniref:(pine wood nematode) hypothetical protein n=1 Tax=Bursaphelenchus xylophilus TaxID=6326 RepID=A0A1I7SMS3_BURXY|nr:unnamed protein product [Bursaphelenchus xylophilus]CAG9130341.1 unnamed protein product [Bursaphelenchus xylophilus]
MAGVNKYDVKQLILERDNIDKELGHLHHTLKTLDVDMETPLVDAEGFPRSDLDLPAIRLTRKNIIALTNDRKALTDEIEKALGELHQKTPGLSGTAKPTEPAVRRPTNRAFLLVENVVYNSPAYHAGLAEGDKVVQFDKIHALNFEGLRQISEVVTGLVGKELHITVLRKIKVHRLIALPGPWDGVGIFGARLQVYNED